MTKYEDKIEPYIDFIEDFKEEAEQEVFKIDAESGLHHHATPCPPLTYTWPSSNATFST